MTATHLAHDGDTSNGLASGMIDMELLGGASKPPFVDETMPFMDAKIPVLEAVPTFMDATLTLWYGARAAQFVGTPQSTYSFAAHARGLIVPKYGSYARYNQLSDPSLRVASTTCTT